MAFKWYPGHYFLTGVDERASDYLHKIADMPGALGLQTRYSLKRLMPVAEGVYDWSGIDADIAACAAAGKLLQILFIDRFKDQWPAWLIEKTAWWDTNGTDYGTQLDVFRPDVQAFLKGIDAQFAARYDASPVLSAFAWQETAANYLVGTREAYANYFIDRVTAGAALFSETPIFQFANFGILDPVAVEAFVTALESLPHVGTGGPDTVPQDSPCLASTNNESNNPFYPIIPLHAGNLPILYDVQYSQYCGKRTTYETTGCTFTPQDIHEFGVDVLKANMMAWKIAAPVGCPTNFNSIKNYLQSVDWRINTDLPANCADDVDPTAPIIRGNYGTRPEIPGTIACHAFDQRTQGGVEIGGEGVTYHDTTTGTTNTPHPRVLSTVIFPDVKTTIDVGVTGASQDWRMGDVDAGEWQEWTIDVPEAATVIPRIEYAAPSVPANPAVRVTLDGQVIAEFTLGSTGGFKVFSTVDAAAVNIPDGTGQVLRVESLTDGYAWTQIEWISTTDSGVDPGPVDPGTSTGSTGIYLKYWSR